MSLTFANAWLPPHQGYRLNPNAQWRDWLLNPNSLTMRLKRVCEVFRIEVRRQAITTPQTDESHYLGTRHTAQALVREIIEWCDDTPVMFARVVMPLASLIGQNKRLRCLGETPLGQVIFKNPLAKRTPFEIAYLNENDFLFQRAQKNILFKEKKLWARRSQFITYQKPILVSEVFLPGFSEKVFENLKSQRMETPYERLASPVFEVDAL